MTLTVHDIGVASHIGRYSDSVEVSGNVVFDHAQQLIAAESPRLLNVDGMLMLSTAFEQKCNSTGSAFSRIINIVPCAPNLFCENIIPNDAKIVLVVASDLKLYTNWRRDTFVGPRPALLAIDLYDLVYRGGPHSPYELNERYPMSCGIYAHRATAPTKRLIAAARRAGIPIFFCTQETRPNNRPPGATSTRRQRPVAPDGYAIYREFTV